MVFSSDIEDDLVDAQPLQQQLEQQVCLRETIQRIRRVLTVDDIHKTTVQTLMDFFQADWIFLLEKGPCFWEPVAQSMHPMSCASVSAFNQYLGLKSVAIKLSQLYPIAINTQSVQQVSGDEHWLSQFPGSWLLVPIHLPPMYQQSGRPWGLVAIGRREQAHIWPIEQQDQAQILVSEIEIALRHGLLYEQLRQDNNNFKTLALTDSLTGLANRRQFDSYFEAEWQRLVREQRLLTLILCDIDYFKRYNDYYGHPTGDVCLAKVSDVLTRCIQRPADLVARYGGEEFAVVLPNSDTEAGHRIALEIQKHLAKVDIPHASSSVSHAVTLTMGIATVLPQHQHSPQELIEAADLALYHAKQQGRDRIYVHAHYYIHDDEHSVSGCSE
ncbi:MAG: diguanylate cyclase [Cyanobacteria bacterium P01_F01_bin.13]